MISFVRTADIAPGKSGAAIGFAHEVVTHLKTGYGLEVEVLRPVGGNPQRIAWSTRYKDLAAYEALGQRLLDDKTYWEMVGKASDCFIGGSLHDSLWQTL